MGRHRDARAHLEDRLCKTSPDDPVLLDRLARCQFAAGEFAEARASLQSAIENDPRQIESYLRLTMLLDAHPEVVLQPEEVKQDADYWTDRLVDANMDAAIGYLTRAGRNVRSAKYAAALQDALGDTPSRAATSKQAESASVAQSEASNAQDGFQSVLGVSPYRRLKPHCGRPPSLRTSSGNWPRSAWQPA